MTSEVVYEYKQSRRYSSHSRPYSAYYFIALILQHLALCGFHVVSSAQKKLRGLIHHYDI